MKRVLTAVILIPLVLLAIFRAPMWLFALLVLVVAVIATMEYLNIAQKTGVVPFRRLTLIMVAGVFLFAAVKVAVEAEVLRQRQSQSPLTEQRATQQKLKIAWDAAGVGGALMLAIPFLFLVRGLNRQDLSSSLPGAAVSSFSLIYIVLPLMALILIRGRPFGSLMLLYLFLVIWAGDVCAYYVGSAIGRHKLAPGISPGKSWEGAIASLVAAGILGALIAVQARPLHQFLESIHLATPQTLGFSLSLYSPPWWHGLLLAIAINIAAQLGDLVESMLKRGAGIKDSGTLLPGHGGVLDRIDSLLFAAPVLLYYANFRGVPF